MKNTYNKFHTAIATRLTTARKRAGLSQTLVAVSLDIPRPSVSEIECGKRRVTAEEFVQFATLYNVSLDWLAERENVMSQGTA